MINHKRLVLSFFVVSICLACSSCNIVSNFNYCENSIEEQIISPNRKFKAVIFDRGCGATVGFITGISIMPINESLSNYDTGNVMFAENSYREISQNDGQVEKRKANFAVEWISDNKVLVYYTDFKIISKNQNFRDIKINFEVISK